ncbi:MAG TPA: iron-containing redox enzyme family protein [Pyrinomonadaceae bacterium]|nr:iron-containing redox enzyme family protein [Pyrinomonadaceae bacterium]
MDRKATSLTTLNEQLDFVLSRYDFKKHSFIKNFAAGNYSQNAIRWWAIKMLPGSNRFNQAFLRVASMIDDYKARTVMLRNIYTEHGELDAERAHVALFMHFMRGIGCETTDVHENDGAFEIPQLRFKRFEIQDNEPILWSLGRFAAIEGALPHIFPFYIEGLKKVFPEIEDETIEYFYAHCELDPEHRAELLEVADLFVHTSEDVQTFVDGAGDMLLSIDDMFSWMAVNMEKDAAVGGNIKNSQNGNHHPKLLVEDRNLYGKNAEQYDDIYYKEPLYKKEVDFVMAHLAHITKPSILDLCAGTGSHGKLFTERNTDFVGIDRSREMLSIARNKVPSAKFIQADIRDFSLEEKFDAVTCMYGAIHYLEQPQDIVRVLRLAYEHLKPGGVFIMDLRESDNLPEQLAGEVRNNYGFRKFWLRRRGIESSDLYVVSAFNLETNEHFLEVHNLFQTDPYRIANWAKVAGFKDVALHPNYRFNENYTPSSGENIVVLSAVK